jgi:mannose-1-phosphate guanylyltransferase/mannose-6-phosphate isomerase
VADGTYYWNSGLFLFRADRYLEALGQHQPAMLSACEQAMAKAERDLDFIRPDAEAFLASPADSIDYAIMEHTKAGGVSTSDCGWSDVGAWSALWEIGAPDNVGNVCEGDVLLHDARNNYVRSESRLVTALGVEDLVVVETADAVMVGARDRVQDTKQVVEALSASNRPEAATHQKVFRPWGSYESLVDGRAFSGQAIDGHALVRPCRCSYIIIAPSTGSWCREKPRSRGERSKLTLGPDQSTYIPIGMKHRLANSAHGATGSDRSAVRIVSRRGRYCAV